MYKRNIIITRGCPHGRIAEAVRSRFNITVPPQRRIGLVVTNNNPDLYIKKFREEEEIAVCPTLMFDGVRTEGLDGEDDYLLFLRVMDASLERLNTELGGMR